MNKLGVLTAVVFAHAHQAVVRPGRPVKNFSDELKIQADLSIVHQYALIVPSSSQNQAF
jgi:hypothetical protein